VGVHRYRKRIFDWSLQNRITRDATLIHFTSEAERDLAQPSVFGRPGAVVPLGVDLERFAVLPPANSFHAQYPEIGNRRIVLFLGRLNFKKGIEILVPAFAAAAAQQDDIHLVLAGPDGGFEATARRLVNEYGIAERTTFTGHLSLDRVAAAYAAAYMFVLPSHTENFGLAPAEAMAAGVPSLLSDRVDVAHAAVGYGACRMVPLSSADWTAAILDLLKNPEATEAMGRAASAYARTTFSWSTIARQLTELYEQALAEHVNKARKKNPDQAISMV
jgi:glycosyltransferase involved in cell wall biosynthesis